MYKNGCVKEVWMEEAVFVATFKLAYSAYQHALSSACSHDMPIPVLHRQTQIDAIIAEIEQLVVRKGVCEPNVSEPDIPYVSDVILYGERLYGALQREISDFSPAKTELHYQVQEKIKELRVCFFYLQQHMCDILIKDVDIQMGKW